MDHLTTLFVVRFGQFKSIQPDSSGGHRVTHFYMTGDLIGLDAIAEERHNSRLMALEDSEVCEISYAAVKKTMATHPEFQQQFLRSMSIALNEECDHSSVLSRSSLDERFACFLLRTGDKYQRLGYSNKSFRLSMTRSDIGSYLGTTVESVSRLIARFNAQYRVSIVGRTVELYDREYLVSVLARSQSAPSGTKRPLM
jgi:CRP/FNR family transcriptional regulator